MANILVFDEVNNINYYIGYTVENAVINQNHTGYANYYIKCSTSQKVIGTGATVPAEIVFTLSAPDYDITEDLKTRSVIIMDKVAGYAMLSSSSSSISSVSSLSSLSSISTLSSQSSISSSSSSLSSSSVSP